MTLLHFPTLQALPGLRHAITTRGEGAFSAPFEALNLAFHVGDDAQKVRDNRRELGAQLGFEAANLVAAGQIHGDAIRRVEGGDAGRGALDWESALPATDALWTSEKRLPLLILVADCAPIVLVEPENAVLAVVHAGWRGAVAGIGGKTAARMQREGGAELGKMWAGIGPCLCASCLEIGPEVAQMAAQVDGEAVLAGWEKPHLDLRGLIRRDLERAGVPPAQIETMENCPKCENERFFSHRGQKGIAGRFGLVAWWE